MDNKAVNKVQPVTRKAKKKQRKDELDRIKQAEKKKRRLEKALATSAAICSELEKKKQQKKEEQQRLDEDNAAIDEAIALAAIRSELEKKKQQKKEEQQRLEEEGAAIAEAVALHVLLGEDSEDSCKIVLNKEEDFNGWEYADIFAAQAVSALQITDDAEVDTVVLNGMLRG